VELHPPVSDEILIFPEAAVPASLHAQLVAIRNDDPHDPSLRPLTMLLLIGGRVVSALDILSKEIAHGGQRFAASGLSRVVTRPELRRQGYGRRLLAAARAAMAQRGSDLGIFTADAPMRPFYESCGWQVLPGCVLIGGTPRRPFPSDMLEKLTFAAFFTAHARRHAHTFSNARIALYPGDIDRLW
jgi:GNAT superfamily N-acetyltransferase